jgi:hypothetical protein
MKPYIPIKNATNDVFVKIYLRREHGNHLLLRETVLRAVAEWRGVARFSIKGEQI